jgi:hypothetical protein
MSLKRQLPTEKSRIRPAFLLIKLKAGSEIQIRPQMKSKICPRRFKEQQGI